MFICCFDISPCSYPLLLAAFKLENLKSFQVKLKLYVIIAKKVPKLSSTYGDIAQMVKRRTVEREILGLNPGER